MTPLYSAYFPFQKKKNKWFSFCTGQQIAWEREREREREREKEKESMVFETREREREYDCAKLTTLMIFC
jgi:hypothetical protein